MDINKNYLDQTKLMSKKIGLIFGITGQDGSFMADLLKNRGYEVFGASRKIHSESNMYAYGDSRSIRRIIQLTEPTEIYNFAGDSNTFDPFECLPRTINDNLTLPANILEAIRDIDPTIKFFQASSVLMFGNEDGSPTYPYGVTKLAAHNLVKMYRETFGIFACSGIFYPHESERRGEYFFSKKVCSAVARIAKGSEEKLELGDLTQKRDWGYAPDYMKAAYAMMQADNPKDYEIGSGMLSKTRDFVDYAFAYVGLDYEDHIKLSGDKRKNDFTPEPANIEQLELDLGWISSVDVREMIEIMVDWELNNTK